MRGLFVIVFLCATVAAKSQDLSLIGKSYNDVLVGQSGVGGVMSPEYIISEGSPMIKYTVTNPPKKGIIMYAYVFNKDSLCANILVCYKGAFAPHMKYYFDKNFQKQQRNIWNKPSKNMQVWVTEFKDINQFFVTYRSLSPDL